MSGSHAVSKTAEGYPVFTNLTDGYIDGYDPVSLYAPHSSLQRTSTWIGMGLILSPLLALVLSPSLSLLTLLARRKTGSCMQLSVQY